MQTNASRTRLAAFPSNYAQKKLLSRFCSKQREHGERRLSAIMTDVCFIGPGGDDDPEKVQRSRQWNSAEKPIIRKRTDLSLRGIKLCATRIIIVAFVAGCRKNRARKREKEKCFRPRFVKRVFSNFFSLSFQFFLRFILSWYWFCFFFILEGGIW